MAFQKAVKSKVPLWLILEGATGCGKTYTSLRLATGIAHYTGGRIALIDTERSSSALYADRFEFDVSELHDWSLDAYLKEAKEAKENGYNILIVDSISHGWKRLSEEVEDIAAARYRGNTMSAWTKFGKPKWNRFVDELFSLGMHVIVCSRVRMGYEQDKGDDGKVRMTKLGYEAQAEKDFPYEFTLVMRMDQENNGFVEKDRSGRFHNKTIKQPGEDFGKELYEWLNSGATVERKAPPATTSSPEPSATAGQEEASTALQTVLDKINKASKMDELEAVADDAGKLDGAEKDAAATAYKAKRAQLKKAGK